MLSYRRCGSWALLVGRYGATELVLRSLNFGSERATRELTLVASPVRTAALPIR
jgi:hypothetical protein